VTILIMMAMPVADKVMHAMVRACGLTSLVEYYDVGACHIWEGYVTQGRGFKLSTSNS
jgi:hypothetical protein